MGLCLVCMNMEAKKVEVKKPGTLAELLTDDEKNGLEELVIVGKLNSSDIQLLRKMAGAKDKNDVDAWTGNLKHLDLREAKFVNDNTPYYTYKAGKNYKIVRNSNYRVITHNRKTGETTIVSKESYLDRLQERRNRNTNSMLKSTSAGRKANKIEEIEEAPQEFVLSEISDIEWKKIKDNRWNEHTDHFESKEDGDSAYYVNYHTAKNWVSGYLFYKCKNLETILLNEDIECISNNAFAGCTALKEIAIPEKVKIISKSAFKRTKSLQKIIISKDTECKLLKLDDKSIRERFFKDNENNLEIVRE